MITAYFKYTLSICKEGMSKTKKYLRQDDEFVFRHTITPGTS
jgi:hypothetical protein